MVGQIFMKTAFVIAALVMTGLPMAARPRVAMEVVDLFKQAEVVVVIRPVTMRLTADLPDPRDSSFGDRDLGGYQAIETSCEILGVLKGHVGSPDPRRSLQIVHFAFKSPKPEFNGGIFMFFHTPPVTYQTVPFYGYDSPKRAFMPYATSNLEFMAFLRELPDGRYVPILGQYDAAASFRLLSTPVNAQRFFSLDGQDAEKSKAAPEPTPTSVTSPAARETRQP
jgi:hypothetical protein